MITPPKLAAAQSSNDQGNHMRLMCQLPLVGFTDAQKIRRDSQSTCSSRVEILIFLLKVG